MGQKYKLNDLAYRKLEYGSGAAATEYDGSVRYIRISDIDENGKLNDTVVSPSVYDDKYTLKDGDILFARTGATVGKTYRFKETDGNFIFAGFLIRFSPNTSLVLPDYVYYFTKSPQYRQFVLRNMKVVAQPNINAKQYGDLEFYVHSLKEQGCIVDKLIKIERLIDLRKEQFELLDNLIKSRFVEMFGDLNLNDKKWIEVSLEKACGVIHRYPTFYGMEYVEKGTPVVRIGNILSDGTVDDNLENYVNVYDTVNEDFPLTIIEKDDILMAVRGDGSAAKRIGIVKSDNLSGANLSPNLLRIKAKEGFTNSIFLFWYLTSDVGQKRLDTYVNKTAKKNIAAKDIKIVTTPVPPIELQNQFATFVQQVDKLKVEVQNSLREAQLLFDSLMQKYFG